MKKLKLPKRNVNLDSTKHELYNETKDSESDRQLADVPWGHRRNSMGRARRSNPCAPNVD